MIVYLVEITFFDFPRTGPIFELSMNYSQYLFFTTKGVEKSSL